MNKILEYRLIIVLIDFIVMVLSGISFLITKWNTLGALFACTVIIGLFFATVDVETHDMELVPVEIEDEENPEI